MLIGKFLENKIKRQLNQNGIDFDVYGTVENKYHELLEGSKKCIFKGLYHEQNSYQTKSVSDSSITFSEPKPMILCLMNEQTNMISYGDYISYGSKDFKVIAKNNIQNLGIAYDISLEEVI